MKLAKYRAKAAIFGLMASLPGSIGTSFETRSLWAKRRLVTDATQHAFNEAVSKLQPGSVCLDLGANVGRFTALLADTGATVHAFEPDPWAFGKLRDAVHSYPNVHIHPCAVGDKKGSLRLFRDPGFDDLPGPRSQGTSAFTSALWNGSPNEFFDVEMVDIFEFVRGLDSRPELVKMDIEGGELAILQRIVEENCSWFCAKMFVETHEAQMVELRKEILAVRQSAARLEQPKIYLDWI